MATRAIRLPPTTSRPGPTFFGSASLSSSASPAEPPVTGATEPGWASEMVLISVIGGAILISNGILGEYVGRIFEEIKERPLYVLSQTANIKEHRGEGSDENLPGATAQRVPHEGATSRDPIARV